MKFFRYILIISVCVIASVGLFAQNEEQNLNELSKEREQAEQDIKNTERLLKSVELKQTAGLQALTLLRKQIDSRRQMLSTIDRQISTIQKQLREKQEAIELLQSDLAEVRRTYAELITKYYNIHTQRISWLMFIMASESVSQAYKRMKYIREILSLLQAQAARITDLTNMLNREIEDMGFKQQSLNNNIEFKEKEMQRLESEEERSRSVLSSLKEQESELKNRLDERKVQYDNLNNQLMAYIREEFDKNPESGLSENVLTAMKDLEQAKTQLPWPVMGSVVASFGADNNHPVYKNIKMPRNDGIDILTQNDAEVFSVFRGTVGKIFTIPGSGLCVIIDHGIYRTVYVGLNSPALVKKGGEVKARQKIGTVAKSADGSVLRFQLWKRMEAQNPENWLLK